jgi:ferrous iron transport protein B
MGAIKREMNNAKWTWAAIGYMCAWAYVVSLITYNVVGLFFGVPFSIWTIVALAALAGLIYLLVRPNPYEEGAALRRKAAAV